MSYDPRDDYEPPPQGYCQDCGCFVTAVLLDMGIGAYEFWGAKGVHRDERWVCPNCDGTITNDAYACDSCIYQRDDFECGQGRSDAESFCEGNECPQWERRKIS